MTTGIISLTPADGSLLDANPKVARFVPVVAQIQCTIGQVPYVYVVVGDLTWMVYDGAAQKTDPLFGDHSSVVALGGDQYLIIVLPNGGWWRSSIEVHFISGAEVTL